MICAKIRPFSHAPGSSALLPKSYWKAIAYPSLLILEGPKGEKIQIFWEMAEKMENFTLFQDLKRGEIEVSGRLGAEFFRLFLQKENENIRLFVKKAPKEGLNAKISTSFSKSGSEEKRFFSGQEIFFPVGEPSFSPTSFEYLSLGLHKKMDVDLIRKRGDLKEILPLWFLLDQWIPPSLQSKLEGVAHLLEVCEKKKAEHDLRGVEKNLLLLWEAGFSSLFVPSLIDEKHLGPFEGQRVSKEASNLVLIKEGAKIIRSLFFSQKENEIHLLPALSPSFVSGSLQQMHCGPLGLLDMEWRGSFPRKVVFVSEIDGEIEIVCSKEIKTFRKRESLHEKGRVVRKGDRLEIKKGSRVFFDRFEK
jgi:hypothetical protein